MEKIQVKWVEYFEKYTPILWLDVVELLRFNVNSYVPITSNIYVCHQLAPSGIFTQVKFPVDFGNRRTLRSAEWTLNLPPLSIIVFLLWFWVRKFLAQRANFSQALHTYAYQNLFKKWNFRSHIGFWNSSHICHWFSLENGKILDFKLTSYYYRSSTFCHVLG